MISKATQRHWECNRGLAQVSIPNVQPGMPKATQRRWECNHRLRLVSMPSVQLGMPDHGCSGKSMQLDVRIFGCSLSNGPGLQH